MIDADSVVFRPGAGLIIPECVGFRLIVDRTQRIGETQIFKLLKALRDSGRKQCIALPGFRIVAIHRLG